MPPKESIRISVLKSQTGKHLLFQHAGIIDPSSTKRLRMSSTALTILHGGHRKVMRIGANESMSTVVQVGAVVWLVVVSQPAKGKVLRNRQG